MEVYSLLLVIGLLNSANCDVNNAQSRLSDSDGVTASSFSAYQILPYGTTALYAQSINKDPVSSMLTGPYSSQVQSLKESPLRSSMMMGPYTSHVQSIKESPSISSMIMEPYTSHVQSIKESPSISSMIMGPYSSHVQSIKESPSVSSMMMGPYSSHTQSIKESLSISSMMMGPYSTHVQSMKESPSVSSKMMGPYSTHVQSIKESPSISSMMIGPYSSHVQSIKGSPSISSMMMGTYSSHIQSIKESPSPSSVMMGPYSSHMQSIKESLSISSISYVDIFDSSTFDTQNLASSSMIVETVQISPISSTSSQPKATQTKTISPSPSSIVAESSSKAIVVRVTYQYIVTLRISGNCTLLKIEAQRIEFFKRLEEVLISIYKMTVTVSNEYKCGSVIVSYNVTSDSPKGSMEKNVEESVASNTNFTVYNNTFQLDKNEAVDIIILPTVTTSMVTSTSPATTTSTSPATTTSTSPATTTSTSPTSSSVTPTAQLTTTTSSPTTPNKKNLTILYATIFSVVAFVLIIIIVVIFVGCRRSGTTGSFKLRNRSNYELGNFDTLSKNTNVVNMYGDEPVLKNAADGEDDNDSIDKTDYDMSGNPDWEVPKLLAGKNDNGYQNSALDDD